MNSELLMALLDMGYLPVIAPVAVSEKGEALNVDADRAAAMVASALKAENLLLLTAVPGLMKNFPDESTLIRQLPQSQLASRRCVAMPLNIDSPGTSSTLCPTSAEADEPARSAAARFASLKRSDASKVTIGSGLSRSCSRAALTLTERLVGARSRGGRRLRATASP